MSRSPRWASVGGPLLDAALAALSGAVSLLLFRWRADWSTLDERMPYSYFGDFLTYGNAVFNAQQGNPFTSATLGGPAGQQLGLSSYGVEWFPAWIVAQLAPATDGPWLATFRYWQLSYVAVGITTFLALRWLGVTRLPSFVGALAFVFIPQHQFNFGSLFYVNYASLPLMLVIAMRVASGARFAELVPAWVGRSARVRAGAAVALIFGCLLLPLGGANYYMLFALLMLAAATASLLLRRRWWPRAIRMGLVTALSVTPLLVSYLPVLLGRRQAHLGPEGSQADRRAFAAYANGGDPFALLTPFKGGIVAGWLDEVAVFRRFFGEYGTTSVTTGSEYVFYRGGVAVFGALLIIAIGFIGGYRRGHLLRRVSGVSPAYKGVVLVLVLAALWFSRGGLGTVTGFILPQVRGYARAAPLVTFASLALLGLVVTQRRHIAAPVRALSFALLCLAMVESISANTRLLQPSASMVVPTDTGLRTRAGFGIELRSLTPAGTRRLVEQARRKLAPGCTVLVLPLVTYPVDFELGVTSYFAYDVVKPGLLPSGLHWTGGGIDGTPHNAFTDSWINRYADGDYPAMLAAAEQRGYCAVLLFASMHEIFYQAGRPSAVSSSKGADGAFDTASEPTESSRFTTPAATVRRALEQRYGQPCYVDEAAEVQLFCR